MFEEFFKHDKLLYRGEKMKRSKPVILLMTVLLAAIAVVFGRNEIGMRNFPFSVIVTSDGGQEELRCMKLDGEYYMFLPSYAEEEKLHICTNLIYDVSIDGRQLLRNQSCSEFPVNTKLELCFRSPGNEGCETVTFVQSRNVATVYIDVPSGNMDYIHEKKSNAEAASVRVYTANGTLDYSGSAESLKGRGNATWEAEKKSYSLTLLGEADLLGMGQAQRWVLLANAYDSSHIRNKIAYDAAKAGLSFTPETCWVDLYLNGEYAGLYLLSERNEVHPERVGISAESGFLVSRDLLYRMEEQGYPHIKTENGVAFRIHHSALSHQELQTVWQSVENAILAENGIDPVSGKSWEELIDLDSWAHKFLLEELFCNFDAGFVSQYFYADTSVSPAKIYAGPIWDFDNSMGRGSWVFSNPGAVAANRPSFHSDGVSLFYYLYQKEAFRKRVTELFSSVYEPMMQELMNCTIREYAEFVAPAASANQIRWNIGDVEKYTERIVDFLRNRTEIFHDFWVNETAYCTVEFLENLQLQGFWMVRKGSVLTGLPEAEGSVWYDTTAGEPFDVTQPVWEDMCLSLQTES